MILLCFQKSRKERISKICYSYFPKIVEEAGLKEGQDLDVSVKNGKIVLEKK